MLCGCGSFSYSVRREQVGMLVVDGGREFERVKSYDCQLALLQIVDWCWRNQEVSKLHVLFELKIVDQNGNPLAGRTSKIQFNRGAPQEATVSEVGTLRIDVRSNLLAGPTAVYEIAVVFPEWESKLNETGEAEELVPARHRLVLRCNGGKCRMEDGNGAPLGKFRLEVKAIPHRDEKRIAAVKAVAEASRLVEEANMPWRSAGFSDSDMKTWREVGFTLDEALQWGPTIPAGEAAKWKVAGWSASDGKTWRGIAADPEEAIGWKKAGFAPEDYKAWRRVGWHTGLNGVLASISVDGAKRWHLAGYKPEEASDWIASGVKEPAEATRTKEKIRKKEQSKECREALKKTSGALRDVGAVALHFGRVSAATMRLICIQMAYCVKNCNKQKCGSVVPALFGGESLVETCENINQTYRDLLSPPR